MIELRISRPFRLQVYSTIDSATPHYILGDPHEFDELDMPTQPGPENPRSACADRRSTMSQQGNSLPDAMGYEWYKGRAALLKEGIRGHGIFTIENTIRTNH